MIIIKLDVTKKEDIVAARAVVDEELEKRSRQYCEGVNAEEKAEEENSSAGASSKSARTPSTESKDSGLSVENDECAKDDDANHDKKNIGQKMKLWALINNAGIGVMGEFEWGNFDTQIRRVLEVNTIGPALITRTFLPLIRESKGRVININSQASRYSAPGMCPYSMSKHASLALTESLRREMFKFGVRVISVEPFFYATEIVNRDLTIKKAEECWRQTPDDIKDAYGQRYYEKVVKMYDGVDSEGGASNDPVQVAHEVNHAVTSAFPKYNYAVAPFFMKILLLLGLLVYPQDAVECLWKVMLACSGLDQVCTDYNQNSVDQDNVDRDKDENEDIKKEN